MKGILLLVLIFVVLFGAQGCSDNFSSAQNSSQTQKKEVVYVGSKNSNKYHYPWCKWAKKISSSNLVVFKSKQDATSKRYIPCKVCRP